MVGQELDEWEQVLPWLRLCLINGLGPLKINRLVAYYGSAHAVFDANIDELKQIVASTIAYNIKNINTNAYITSLIKKSYEWLSHSDAHYILCPTSSRYPEQLKQIKDYPSVLFLSGNINWLSTPQVAIVGTRKPTLSGKYQAEKIAKSLALKGLTITSGMAKGIDTAAHHGALTETHSSIGVLGSGIDVVYPSEKYVTGKKTCNIRFVSLRIYTRNSTKT